MKRVFQLAMAAALICGISFAAASCSNDDNPVTPDLNLSEKIIGKWMTAESKGKLAVTNRKSVVTFVSATKAYMSKSFDSRMESGDVWISNEEADVVISGNKVTLTSHSDEHTTRVNEYIINDINDIEFTANVKLTKIVDGNVVLTRNNTTRLTKVTADYSAAILGLWECQGITGGETNNDDNARLEFLADGTYNFYRRSDAGVWSLVPRERNEYFVDGSLLCTRWQAEGEQMSYEWWEIASAADGRMQWTALRQQADGSTFQQGVTWKKVE